MNVIQGYFLGRPAVVPARATGGTRPRTYQELTLQAHQRSSGLAIQSSGNKNAFVVPAHLATFGRRAGQKLPTVVQRKMESFFGTDFSDVQVHSGPEASAIGALAFTHGSNIYFAPGQYNPNSHFGQELLAHELTHVVQQRAGRVRNPFGSGMAVVQDPMLEAEAERMGKQVAMNAAASPRLFTFAQARLRSPIQRAEDPVERSLTNFMHYRSGIAKKYGADTIRRVLRENELTVRGHHSGAAGDAENPATTQDCAALNKALKEDAEKSKTPADGPGKSEKKSVGGKRHSKGKQEEVAKKKEKEKAGKAKDKRKDYFRKEHEGLGHEVAENGYSCNTCGAYA
jgi:hypothetical protein